VQAVGSDTPLTQLAPDGFAPSWSPDGKQIAFLRQTTGAPNLWTVHASGGDAKAVTTSGIAFGGYTYLPYNRSQTEDFEWSQDGSSLVYCARDGGMMNVWQVSADGSNKKQLSDNTNERLLFFNPTVSADGQVAWLALSPPQTGRKETTWSIWLARDGKAQQLFESDTVLGIVGWSETPHELIYKTIKGASSAPGVPVDVSLFLFDAATGQHRLLSELKATYFQNLKLSPARNLIAFVTRENGPDTLRVITAKGASPKTILSSSDLRVYFSALNWGPSGKTIVYGKQSSWTMLSMLDNFRPN
jgi:Tol biopolymer transport system component